MRVLISFFASTQRQSGLHRAVLVLALCLAGVWGAQAWAAPAPWYYWRSEVDGKRVCAQVSPGAGWKRDSPPYDGANCQGKPRVFVIPAR